MLREGACKGALSLFIYIVYQFRKNDNFAAVFFIQIM